MINSGYASSGIQQLDYGVPFIAAFDKYTGENHFLAKVGIGPDVQGISRHFNGQRHCGGFVRIRRKRQITHVL